MEGYKMSDVEVELIKEQIRKLLRYKKAGQCYSLLIELAEEGKNGAVEYHNDEIEYEYKKDIPLNPSWF